jgi:hypothetical protein
MLKKFPIRLCVMAALAGGAWAQGAHNIDVSFSWGPAHTIAGTTRVLGDSLGFSAQFGFGYQIARLSATSLMAEFCTASSNPNGSGSGHPVYFGTTTVGLRFAIPLHARVSLLTDAGGGYGRFLSPLVLPNSNYLYSQSTTHGVFTFGGGVDFRLTRLFSFRAEVKDVVSGSNLAGAPGRHHAMPLFGVAVHL